MHKLVLYYFDTCPFCQKVLRVVREKNIALTLKDIHKNPQDKAELLRIGGKTQVPCLVIDDVPMFESSDIVAWLMAHY